MNASHDWLLAFVPLQATPAQLRDLLTAHTATVEELVALRTDLNAVVIARVEEARRHPDSDHLWVTQVNAGGPALLEVVCGAQNVTAGKLYPFAGVGTSLPNGMKIERRKIRGIVSNGMLCSARELGLGEDHEGILELDVSSPPGTPLLTAMPMGDTRLVIDVGANRPDLLSHLGLARELSAVTGTPWVLPALPDLSADEAPGSRRATHEGSTAGIAVRVEPATGTRRYMAAVVRGVAIGPSPEWLAARLDAVGVRSINNVVDATNYVLHELGQPVHAFDLAKLSGTVTVRRALAREKLVTLDGATHELPGDAVVIADDRGAQAVAGVMGGRDSEVTGATRDLLIEVASFDPRLTRAARKALGLSTDASYRFERGVDPELAPRAMDRVLRLILGVAGGSIADGPLDLAVAIPAPREVRVRAARVRQILGIDVPQDRARHYLEAAGFMVLTEGNHELHLRVPSWRGDVHEEIDIVEEIARFHGYDALPDEIRPFRPTSTHDDAHWTIADRVREVLVGRGLYEIRPMPFVAGGDQTHVRVANPLAENEAHLRRSLMETLARRTEYNLAHRVGDVRMFEIGSVFARSDTPMPREQLRVGVILMGRTRPSHFTEPRPPHFDAWDAKGIAELIAAHGLPDREVEVRPGKADGVLWEIATGGRTVGHVTRVALDAPVWAPPAFGIEIVLGEVDTDAPAPQGSHSYKEASRPPRARAARYRTLPAMPAAEFDLALLVPHGVTVAEVESAMREAAGELLERLELFDQYTGQGIDARTRSLAWRLTFRHPDRTLRDKEIEARRGKILSALEQELHVRQRSA